MYGFYRRRRKTREDILIDKYLNNTLTKEEAVELLDILLKKELD